MDMNTLVKTLNFKQFNGDPLINIYPDYLAFRVQESGKTSPNTSLDYASGSISRVFPDFKFSITSAGLLKSFYMAVLKNSGIEFDQDRFNRGRIETVTLATFRIIALKKLGRVMYDDSVKYVSFYSEIGKTDYDMKEFIYSHGKFTLLDWKSLV